MFNKVEDITHHSKRTQRGNLISAGVIKPNTDIPKPVESVVPQNVTPEKAIEFFKKNATGEYTNLYTSTAKWLEQYLTVSKSAIRRAESDVATVDISEVNTNE